MRPGWFGLLKVCVALRLTAVTIPLGTRPPVLGTFR